MIINEVKCIKKPPITGGFAERAGLEPATLRLTAECSTIELPFNIHTENQRITNIHHHRG